MSAEEAQEKPEKPTVEKNGPSKFIRILTVIAYACSVSMAAVLLSLYYIFLWDPNHSQPSALSISQDDQDAATQQLLNAANV